MCTCTFDDYAYMMKEYAHHHHHHHYSHTTHGVCCCVLFVGMLWPREHNALHSLENLGKKTRTQTALHFSQSSERSYYLSVTTTAGVQQQWQQQQQQGYYY